MTARLASRKILITGAASGMGQEIARLFASEGASLALLDMNEAGVQAMAGELGAHGFRCDVTDRDSVNRVVAEAGQLLSGLDGIVNAAGILDITPFVDLDPASWDRMLAVNMTGPFNIVKAALPFLTQAPCGDHRQHRLGQRADADAGHCGLFGQQGGPA